MMGDKVRYQFNVDVMNGKALASVTVQPPTERDFSFSHEDTVHKVSIFGVDAPCYVMTPFDADLESFPRFPTRSMSTCWVVEKATKSSPRREEFPLLKERAEPESVIKDIATSSSIPDSGSVAAPKESVEEDEGNIKFRIVDTVPGMWKS
jgi:hypothetical protein